MALGLDGTVVLALAEGEAAGKRSIEPSCGRAKPGRLSLGDLAEQGVLVRPANADQVAKFDDVGWLGRSWPEAVGGQMGASPFHAVPAHRVFLAVTSQYLNAVVSDLAHDGWLEPGERPAAAQLVQPFAALCAQLRFGAAVAMALVVADEAVDQGLVGGFLAVAAHAGDDPKASV